MPLKRGPAVVPAATPDAPEAVVVAEDQVESAVVAPAAGVLDRAGRPAEDRAGAAVVMRLWIPLIWGSSATEALAEAAEWAAAEPTPAARMAVVEEPGTQVRTPTSAARVARARRLHPPVIHSVER
jgi:hypothetical protein